MSDMLLMEKACEKPSIKEALEFLGLRAAGGNYKALKKWAAFHGLKVPEVSNFDKTKKARAKLRVPHKKVFCKDSKYQNSTSIKKRLVSLGIKYECSICKNNATWNNRPLVLQLDHVNSIHSDNRIENLRLLCPNCHSQTEGYAGKSSIKHC